MKMELKNVDGKDSLVITIEIERPFVASASGKTDIVASTRGNCTPGLLIDGRPVVVGVNAYLKR